MAEHAERAHRAASRIDTTRPALVATHANALQRRAAAQHDGYATLLRGVPAGPQPVQRKTSINRTGLPDRLKRGVEVLSGVSLDGVSVHRNSARPAQLNALAYAQGSDIHLGPGQDHHLPHEAWHIAQQAQGRVRPSRQLKAGVAINDDVALEHEADRMGALALHIGDFDLDPYARSEDQPGAGVRRTGQPAQRKITMADGKEFEGAKNAGDIIAAIRASGLVWRDDLGKTLAGWLNKGDHRGFVDFAALLNALVAARAGGVAINDLGRAREQGVAAASGGMIADTGKYGQDLTVHLKNSDRHVKLDIIGATFYAIVGGAAKAKNLGKFGTICRDLVAIAGQDKKEPRVYCAANTPADVIALATSIVGIRNVYQSETGDHWEVPLDVNPYADDMPGYGKAAPKDPATGLAPGAMPYIN